MELLSLFFKKVLICWALEAFQGVKDSFQFYLPIAVSFWCISAGLLTLLKSYIFLISIL